MKETLTIKTDSIRKVRGKNLFRYTVEVINEVTGASKSRSFMEATRNQAKGKRAMFLRNATQGKAITQVNLA